MNSTNNNDSITAVIQELTTIGDFIRYAVSRFNQANIFLGHGTASVWDEAYYLVTHQLSLPAELDPAFLAATLTLPERRAIVALIDRRIHARIPAAYLTQEAWFAGLPFYVDPRVLIPRSPLAELIQHEFAPWLKPEQVHRILDIGTGSGCIAISCAHVFPHSKVDAVDCDPQALQVAALNCAKHHMHSQVRLLHGDLFSALPSGEKYDIIISNPPYVGAAEMETLPPEYYHEPKQALLAGTIGVEIVERILSQASQYLTSQGILIVEVGNSAPEILHRYPQVPFTWLEFTSGESEVFLLTAAQLKSSIFP